MNKYFIVSYNFYSVDRLKSLYSTKGVIERTKYTLLAINGDRHTIMHRIWFIGLFLVWLMSCIIFCSDLTLTLLRLAPTFFCHCHIAPTYLWPCSDVSDVFGHCHNVPTLLRPCSDISDVFSHSVTTITMLRPYSDVFSHTITILQFRTLTPLNFVMLHPLPDPRHHSRFCG